MDQFPVVNLSPLSLQFVLLRRRRLVSTALDVLRMKCVTCRHVLANPTARTQSIVQLGSTHLATHVLLVCRSAQGSNAITVTMAHPPVVLLALNNTVLL